jgi:undecaprenyl-diphosphatase
MNFLQSFILGIVEGITEFLPISSTGHLILASTLMGIAQTEFVKTFEIVIQLGAILAVVVLYWRAFLNLEVLKKVIVAFIPTGLIGLALYKLVKTYLLGNEVVVLWALLIGGIALIVFEYFYEEKETAVANIRDISYGQAVSIGLFQALSIIPGTSRSAATIVGGLVMNLKRSTIVQFSFLLAVPTMLAASGLDLVKTTATFTLGEVAMLTIGFAVAFVVALFSIRFLLQYVRSHTFVAFGIYRIAVSLVFFWFIVR